MTRQLPSEHEQDCRNAESLGSALRNAVNITHTQSARDDLADALAIVARRIVRHERQTEESEGSDA